MKQTMAINNITAQLQQANHYSLSSQQAVVAQLMEENDLVMAILQAIKTLPGAWVGAGLIFQNIWNQYHGFAPNSHIKDIDILYWDDSDLSWAAENAQIEKLKQRLADIRLIINFPADLPIDMKNIARVHLWYEERFGIKKTPYQSVEESIATWPVIAGCLAMRLDASGGDIEFCAPFGFADALAMRVRPNKVLIGQDIYQAKAQKWQQQWPQLTVFPW
ncbi:MAG: hypothetical protein ACI8WB_005527 [Phenylobacterium sp.]|jgi:hypothetical protein